ncbi:MAG: hypothetical protein ACI8S6_005578, partial [Myxococcota bacterium]
WCSAGLLLCSAGCALPPAASSPFLAPVAVLKQPATDVMAVVGADALGGAGLRRVQPLGDNAVIDVGVNLGYAYTSLDGGVWLRTRKNDQGWGTGLRLGASGGAGQSAAAAIFTEESLPPLTEALADLSRSAFLGLTIHGQVARKRPGKSGKFSLTYGGGATARLAEPDDVEESPLNLHVDLSLRYDLPSKVFFGIGGQTTLFAIPIPAAAIGYRF